MNQTIKPFPAKRNISATDRVSPVDVESLPLSPDEMAVFRAYFTGRDRAAALQACDRLEVPTEVMCDRLNAAVGQILVRDIQARLPQWAACYPDHIVFGRKYRKRSAGQGLAFLAQHLFTLNWADSGPGYSWPEAYHLVDVPGYERVVVTASQDSSDVWGCTDQALGHFPSHADRLKAARRVICGHWKGLSDEDDQTPWAYLFDEGLITKEVAEQWKRRVWAKSEYRDW